MDIPNGKENDLSSWYADGIYLWAKMIKLSAFIVIACTFW